MLTSKQWLTLVAGTMLLLAGCGDFGQVEQGLVVATEGNVLTLILDSNPRGDASYDRTPAVTVRIPEDTDQMGPAPAAGKLVKLDTEASEVTVYNAAEQRLITIGFELVEREGGVYPDDARVAASGAPKVDAANRTVTLYSPRTRELVTITVPDEYLSLPADTWQSGDEVRYYFRDPAQALRMMNVSQTRIG